MTRTPTLVMALVATMLLTMMPAKAAPLDDLRGEARVLLLFAKSRSDASLDRQVDVLRDYRPDLKERDMLVLRTAGQEETRATIGYVSLPRGAARELKRLYTPFERGLTVVLVGKDGGEKGRWNRLVQPEELFALIDTMPMRQREMREDAQDADTDS